MPKFNLSITAHVDNDTMLIWSKNFDENIMQHNIRSSVTDPVPPVLDRLMTLMPCADWQPDDGDDIPGTNYCQYTHYEPRTGNYLLGAWYEIDETTGTIKL